MQWVEVINARMAETSEHRELKHLFREIRAQVNTSINDQLQLIIYRNGLVENDWSIHLCWTTDQKPTGKSELGIKLAELLRPLALVDHAIWIESRKNVNSRTASA